MKKSSLLMFHLVLVSSQAFAQEAAVPDGYQLVWADEFEHDGRPDPLKWSYETGFVRNEELQWVQPDNAFCMLLNLAIGGTQGGDPSQTPFPTRYEIDYVRIYQHTRGKD